MGLRIHRLRLLCCLRSPLKSTQVRSSKKSSKKKLHHDSTRNDRRHIIFSFSRVNKKPKDVSVLEQSPLPAYNPSGGHTADFVMNRLTEPEQRHEDDDIVKENCAPFASDVSSNDEEQQPNQTKNKGLAVETSVTQAVPTKYNALKANSTSFTPRVAVLEKDSANLLAHLQASYKTSHDILKEIQREQAELLESSPLRRSPLKPTQGNNKSTKKCPQKKLNDDSTANGSAPSCLIEEKSASKPSGIMKENCPPDTSGHDGKQNPNQTKSKNVVETSVASVLSRKVIISKPTYKSFTPRIAVLDEDTANLLDRLQASYKASHDILKEIQLKQAELLDLSEKSEDSGDIAAYCKGKEYMDKGHGDMHLGA
jgi:hypothetical protein